MDMKFRHEWKHEINTADYLALRSRLYAIAKPEPHGVNGVYKIRSLYFDDLYDTALKEKINGINFREKFRIRYYNHDTSFIRLEKKSKINGLCNKQQAMLTVPEVQAILDGDYSFMATDPRELVKEFYTKIRTKGLRPKTLVDYDRDAFIFPAGNVRVTLDYHIRTGMLSTDFLNPNSLTVPASDAIILEVKWDEFLPDVIRDAVALEGRRSGAFSKYEVCRIYG